MGVGPTLGMGDGELAPGLLGFGVEPDVGVVVGELATGLDGAGAALRA